MQNSNSKTMEKYRLSKMIIVGAGPSGLLLGILLAKQGIKVSVVEMSDKLDANPRATHHAPVSVRELRRAGVLDEVIREGFKGAGVCWRTPDHKVLAGAKPPPDKVNDPDGQVVLSLDKLDVILLRAFLEEKTAEVLWKHKVVAIEQDENEARVKVETEEGEKWLGADYVVGCDGANSVIRRSLFGDWEFPGETLKNQIVATNVYYNFEKFGYWDSNFVCDPSGWFMAAKITRDGLWRVTYGDIPGLTTEEYLKRQPEVYERILPGNPKPGDYKLVSASPYKLHQRCAKKFRVGRFLLAADAAHLCNPFGGLGLTGGFADVSSLYDSLIAMHNGLTDDSILDAYNDVRHRLWHEMINPISRSNFAIVSDGKADDKRAEFFGILNNPGSRKRDSIIAFVLHDTYTLVEDMTPYFNKPK